MKLTCVHGRILGYNAYYSHPQLSLAMTKKAKRLTESKALVKSIKTINNLYSPAHLCARNIVGL